MNQTPPSARPVVREARADDLQAVLEFIQPFVDRQQVLPRTPEEMAKLLLNGFVAEAEGRITGFAAIEIYSKKLAEVQCLAVDELFQRQGVGRELVHHCVDRARREQVRELMAITASDKLFHDCGFDYSLPDQKKAVFIQTRLG